MIILLEKEFAIFLSFMLGWYFLGAFFSASLNINRWESTTRFCTCTCIFLSWLFAQLYFIW